MLSQLPRPTIDFVIPDTVPVKVGLAKSAFVPKLVVIESNSLQILKLVIIILVALQLHMIVLL